MPPKEPKEEHINEFIKALKEEFKKDKPPKDPRVERMLERAKIHGRPFPPSMILGRLSHINKMNRNPMEQETWLTMARTVYEMWEAENYPEEPTP